MRKKYYRDVPQGRLYRNKIVKFFQVVGFSQMGGTQGYKPKPAMERNASEAYFLTMLEGCVDNSSTILKASAPPILIKVFIISDTITKS